MGEVARLAEVCPATKAGQVPRSPGGRAIKRGAELPVRGDIDGTTDRSGMTL
jgi:hypothetical protein